MNIVREIAELIFTTSLGGTRVVRIPDPTAVITQATLDIAESGILAANPFDETVGNLVELKRADRFIENRLILIQPSAV